MWARASLAAVAALAGGCGRLGFDVDDDAAAPPGDGSCAVALCEGFDDGAPFARWDQVLGAPNIDTAFSVSPPGSMSVTRVDAQADGTAYLEKAFPGSWSELDCSYAFRLDHQPQLAAVHSSSHSVPMRRRRAAASTTGSRCSSSNAAS